ncbi:MAG TPA: outer membrane lipoprotein-sorting protein [Dongiaceae bacterium]|nr:outer membrane lipoprotein-sorting protein [Dongiaceae bacterium]
MIRLRDCARLVLALVSILLSTVLLAGNAEGSATAQLPEETASLLTELGLSAEKAEQVMKDKGLTDEQATQLLKGMRTSSAATAQQILDMGMTPDDASALLQKMGMPQPRIDKLMADMSESITREQKARDSGWGDTQARMVMTLRGRDGSERQREILVKTLEVPGDGDKSLSVFATPKDVKDTALLTETHISGPDSQWLYLPKLKRVKRISMLNKSSPFMGSEFSYEDLASFEVEKYTTQYLRSEQYDGRPCFVVELTPKYEHSGYSKLVAFIDKQNYLALRMDYFNLEQKHFKSMYLEDYKQFEGKYWRPTKLTMKNIASGDSTAIIWHEYRFRTGLNDSDFTQQALKRPG